MLTCAVDAASSIESKIAEKLGPKRFNVWFKNATRLSVTDNYLRVSAPNHFVGEWIERHFSDVIIEAAREVTGSDFTLSFAIDPELAKTLGKKQPDRQLEFVTNNPARVARESRRGGGPTVAPNLKGKLSDFIAGPSNRLAYAAAVSVIENPASQYNPLFIHGGCGLGKTHLLQAICHAIRERDPEAVCLYISCETFVNHFIKGVESGALHQFRYRYRCVDVLVIDDIQFLAERERSQEEFFHTFNTLHQSHRQIILSADCPPSEIPSLEERLTSRFNSGLVALMDRPCLETRMAIVRKKAKLRCITVPEDVVHLIASRIDTNIRDLEGALTRIDALSHAHGGQLTLELAETALGGNSRRIVKIPVILETVADHFNLKVSELQGKKRSKTITYPRHVSMYLARQLTSQSLEEIGNYFGGRDHTTVLHASRAITRLLETDSDANELIQEMTREIRNATH